MALFGFAAFVLGWTAVVPLACALLAKRTSPQENRKVSFGQNGSPALLAPSRPAPKLTSPHDIVPRLASAFALSSWGCICWCAPCSWPARVLLVAGGACLLVIVCCDLAARIIPWETCTALLACGSVFSLLELGISSFILSLGLAIACMGVSGLCCLAASRCGRPRPLGVGDLRLMPGLFAFCGAHGSFCGACACSLLMAFLAIAMTVAALIRRRDVPRTLPMAPGFALWFAVGTMNALG